LLRGSWFKNRTCKGKGKISDVVAVVAVAFAFAPGLSNQKPFTEMVDATTKN
jgi:hypothetical protein